MADSVVCGSSLYSNRTICAVMRYIDDFIEKSEARWGDAQASMEELGALTEQAIVDISGIDYQAATGSISTGYAQPDTPNFSGLAPATPEFPEKPVTEAPTIPEAPEIPEAYVVPDADTLLITTEVFDATFNREQERIARQTAKGEREAVYRAARLGVGGSTSALALALQNAEEATKEGVSLVARDKAIGEGDWLRDDVKTLHDMHIRHDLAHPKFALESYKGEHGMKVDAYTAMVGGYRDINSAMAGAYDSQVKLLLGYLNAESDRLRALITSEGERRGWTTLESQNALADANALTKFAVEKAQYIGELNRKTQEAESALITGYLQALVSAASVGLSGSGGQSVSE